MAVASDVCHQVTRSYSLKISPTNFQPTVEVYELKRTLPKLLRANDLNVIHQPKYDTARPESVVSKEGQFHCDVIVVCDKVEYRVHAL